MRAGITRQLRLLWVIALLGVLVVVASPAHATPGDLDPSFGSGGKVVTAVSPVGDGANAVSVQPDGKIVVAGFGSTTTRENLDFAVARYNPDGRLDPTFGVGGTTTTSFGAGIDEAKSIVLQPDGKIVVAGYITVSSSDQDVALVRYLPDGSLDAAYGTGGKVVTAPGAGLDGANAVALQSDGKAVVAGFATTGTGCDFGCRPDLLVARYSDTGVLDPTFGDNGLAITSFGTRDDIAKGLVIGADDKIVVGGSTYDGSATKLLLVRYDEDGAVDTAFGSNGTVTWNPWSGLASASAVALAPDGKIIAAGFADPGFLTLRFNPDGTLDPTFEGEQGGSGAATSVAALPDGKVVVVGASGGPLHGFSVARYTSGGRLDDSFYGNGTFVRFSSDDDESATARGLAVQADGKLVVVGTTYGADGRGRFALARLAQLTPPGPPVNVTGTAANGQATVSWSSPASDGGAAITSYVVESPQGSMVATVPGSARSAVIGSLTNGATYSFTVAAANTLGRGSRSPSVTLTLPPPPPPPSPPPPPPPPPPLARSGYWMVEASGHVYAFGQAGYFDALNGARSNVVDVEPTPSGNGYWLLTAVGEIYAYGDARWHGQPSGLVAGEVVTSMSAYPKGAGYWVFTSRGRAFAYGGAPYMGDMFATVLNGPVLDSIPTPSGQGYYMVASDGGIFTFGDARFHGSMGGHRLNAPVQSLAPDPDGVGYWLVASDGGVFSFEAPFRGSTGSLRLNKPITGMVPFGNGYLMVAEDGGIFNFSDRSFFGSLGNNPPSSPVVAVAVLDH